MEKQRYDWKQCEWLDDNRWCHQTQGECVYRAYGDKPFNSVKDLHLCFHFKRKD